MASWCDVNLKAWCVELGLEVISSIVSGVSIQNSGFEYYRGLGAAACFPYTLNPKPSVMEESEILWLRFGATVLQM